MLRPNYRAASRQKQQLTSTLTRARAALSHDADWSFNESYTRQPRAGHKFLEARQAQQMEGRPRIPPRPPHSPPFNIIKARRGLGRIPPNTEQKTHRFRANPPKRERIPWKSPANPPANPPASPPPHLPWGCSCGDGEVACHAMLSALHTYALPFFRATPLPRSLRQTVPACHVR